MKYFFGLFILLLVSCTQTNSADGNAKKALEETKNTISEATENVVENAANEIDQNDQEPMADEKDLIKDPTADESDMGKASDEKKAMDKAGSSPDKKVAEKMGKKDLKLETAKEIATTQPSQKPSASNKSKTTTPAKSQTTSAPVKAKTKEMADKKVINSKPEKPIVEKPKPVGFSHDTWNVLLGKYVSNGKVNYSAFKQEEAQLDTYLDMLKKTPIQDSWSRNKKLAYWINAYNAFTVQIVMRNYPTPGIKEIKNGIPFVNTVWDIKFINIENQTYDLNNIEHGIIRQRFDEPRIHFALNCASISCPRLRNEAFFPDRLDEQLTDNARYFLSNPIKNKLNSERSEISKIFKWYGVDFRKGDNTVRKFIDQYSDVKITADTKIDHMGYDWRLNDQLP